MHTQEHSNHRAILLLFIANSISGCAQGISMIAIPWYFNAVLGKGHIFGIFYSCVTIGSFFWSFLNGSIIDKYDRKKIFIYINVIGFVILSVASLSGQFHLLPYWIPAAIVFIITQFIYNIHYPNLYAFVQQISPPGQYAKVTSYIEIQGQATTVLGGALAAVLLEGCKDGILHIGGFNFWIPQTFAPWDLHQIFMLDALTYLIGFFIIINIKYKPFTAQVPDPAPLLQRLAFGVQYLWKQKVVLLFGWASLFVFITVIMNTFYLMPNYIHLFLKASPSVYAGSELWFAFGAMCAGFITRFILPKIHESLKIIFLGFLAASMYFLFMYNTWLPVFFLASLILGFSNASIRILRISYIFKIVPNNVIGRVNSILSLSSYLFRAALGLLFSIRFFTTESGITYVMLILGVFCAIGSLLLIFSHKRLSLIKASNQ